MHVVHLFLTKQKQMKNSRSQNIAYIRPKQLRSFLVSTRAVLVAVQIFFAQDSCDSSVNKKIRNAIQTIDTAGRQLGDNKLVDNSKGHFRS